MAGKNYAAGAPMGNNQVPLFEAPAPYKALKQYYKDNGSVSSVITLTENTTAVEIASGNNIATAIRWVNVTDGSGANTSVITSGATANFDHIVPANYYRKFVVPIETTNNSEGSGSVVGQNIANGLFRRLAFINAGVGSVFVTEYGSSNSY